MCGICGVVDFSGPPVEVETVRRMTAALQHRGPDCRDVYVAGPVGLGHARLSIIDLSAAGDQPMQAPGAPAVLVYNGEVYNFPEIRVELEQRGVAFRGHSDSEVVLHAYLAWGPGAFARFNGMFALALWDGSTGTLHLARDRFGIKPLYLYATPKGVVFGSEIKALLASGRVPRAADARGLHEYLWYGNTLGATTAFEGVTKLLPGHRLEVRADGTRTEAFWRLEDVRPQKDTAAVATERVRELLEASVKRHLVSDVPVGVFLSGGIDSSAVTALAARHYSGRLQTFSVGFDFQEEPDELARARRIAERFGTEHHELHVSGGNLPDTIERLVEAHDVPFADAANIPLYLLCERLGGQIKVVLQGDGGDEIFGGYRRYGVLASERLWRLAAPPALAALGLLPRSPERARQARFLRAMSLRDPALRMALLLTMEPYDAPPTAFLAPAWRERVAAYDPFDRYREVAARFAHLDPVQRMLYVDTSVLLPDDFLEKVDRSTMAHSIEVRVPFLDADLCEYALGLPAGLKVRRGQKKWVLRQALRGLVPDDVLDGRKTGFGVPYASWLRGPLAAYLRRVLLDDATARAGLFDRAPLERAVDEHISGARNHGFLLWKALHLALWHHRYLAA